MSWTSFLPPSWADCKGLNKEQIHHTEHTKSLATTELQGFSLYLSNTIDATVDAYHLSQLYP